MTIGCEGISDGTITTGGIRAGFTVCGSSVVMIGFGVLTGIALRIGTGRALRILTGGGLGVGLGVGEANAATAGGSNGMMGMGC